MHVNTWYRHLGPFTVDLFIYERKKILFTIGMSMKNRTQSSLTFTIICLPLLIMKFLFRNYFFIITKWFSMFVGVIDSWTQIIHTNPTKSQSFQWRKLHITSEIENSQLRRTNIFKALNVPIYTTIAFFIINAQKAFLLCSVRLWCHFIADIYKEIVVFFMSFCFAIVWKMEREFLLVILVTCSVEWI